MCPDEGSGPRLARVGDDPFALAQRVRVDVPRVLPEDILTTQAVDPPPDTEGGRKGNMELMTRNAAW